MHEALRTITHDTSEAAQRPSTVKTRLLDISVFICLFVSLSRINRKDENSFQLINLKFSSILRVHWDIPDTFVQNMEALRHHMTISQPKYQTSGVNKYVIDYLLSYVYC